MVTYITKQCVEGTAKRDTLIIYGENYLTLICIYFKYLSSKLYDRLVKVKKAKIRNQYNHVLHLTRDTNWESHKNTSKHHTHESQEVSSFPADYAQGCKEQTVQYNKDKRET